MNLYHTTQFKKDYKRIKKQNKDLSKFRAVIEKLVAGQSLGPQYGDHQLTGNWKGHRDCHIEPDWLLIYRRAPDDLYLERTGSHSDLFKKQFFC
ncbi:MAG: type II toxin-antitoxin system YafQ family toxin [Deltaproteobacteria bacterium]|nr:type II toxin-antitoxin system YafQ family toxin [Deltaproteobacteria bacterium]